MKVFTPELIIEVLQPGDAIDIFARYVRLKAYIPNASAFVSSWRFVKASQDEGWIMQWVGNFTSQENWPELGFISVID
jgi:hypothetical protein